MADFLMGINVNLIYIFAFILAFAITWLFTPHSKKIAFKLGAVDYPKDRGVHTKPMPLAGGTAIVLGFFITIVLFSSSITNLETKALAGIIVGGILITVVGMLDDIYDLNPKTKLLFQVLAALLVVQTGSTIQFITIPFVENMRIDFGVFSNIVTVLWIVGLTNAVNLIDGLDGLAAGVSSIASLCLMFLAIISGDSAAVILTAALAGSCLGFLPHNFSPATIFMGDTGSTFLGFTLSVISIHGMLKSYTLLTLIGMALVLGLPIFDTSFAILRRLVNGKPVSQADRGHLHHKLLDRGLSQKKAVLTLYGISSGLGIAGILVAMNDIVLAMLIIAVMFVIWIFDYIYHKRQKKVKRLD